MSPTKSQFKNQDLTIDLSWDNEQQKNEFDTQIGTWLQYDWLNAKALLGLGQGGPEQAQAVNYVLMKIWQLADPAFYEDKTKPDFEEWQKTLLKQLLALSMADPDWWAEGDGTRAPKGVIDITINYTWKQMLSETIYESSWIMPTISSDLQIPTDFNLISSGNPYDYNAQYPWHDRIGLTSEGLTGAGMAGKILDVLPQIMQRYPSILMSNPIISKVITENYSYNKTQDYMIEKLNEIVKKIGSNEISFDIEITDDIYHATYPFLHGEQARWGMGGKGKFSGEMKEGNVGSNVFASNTIKEVTIPAMFFQSADGVAMTEDQAKADSTISDMFLQKIRYNDWVQSPDGATIINPGLYTANPDGGGKEVLDRDIWNAFMEELKNEQAIASGTQLVDWQPKVANVEWGWEKLIDDVSGYWPVAILAGPIGAVVLGYAAAATWIFGSDQADDYETTFEENIKKPAARAFNRAYTGFILMVMDAAKKYSKDKTEVYNVREIWESVFKVDEGNNNWKDKNHPFWCLLTMILVDKEMGRRSGKWWELAGVANKCLTREDGSEDCADLQYRDLNGQLEKYDKEVGAWSADDVADLEAQIGGGMADGFLNDEEQKQQLKSDALTDEEIENRKKSYKQCALMLKAHTLKNQLVDDLSRQYNSNPSDPQNRPFRGRFYMAKCQTDQERLIGNLVASPAGAAFFDVPPQVMTYLTPKLRLYKVENNTGGELIDTEFIFSRYTDINRKENYVKKQDTFLESDFDKGSGCGVKEFSWEFNGTNPATARNDIKAKLTLFFQSFNDFVKARVAANGKEYRFVDLVIQPAPDGNKINGVEIVDVNQYDPSFYRIRAEVGYWIPKDDIPWNARETQRLTQGIKQTNRSFYLCMVDHNIDVNNDGTVTIEISYRAYVETALKTYRFDALSTPELQQKRKEAQNTLAEMIQKKCNKQDIRDYKVAIEAMEEELRKASLQSIIRRLLQRDKIYITKLQEAHKNFFFTNGYFEEVELIPISNSTPAKSEQPSPAEKLSSAGSPDEGEIGKILLESQIPEDGFDFTDMQNTTIQFFFFGDLLDTISDTLYETDGITPVESMENTKYILGSFDFDAYLGDAAKNDSVMNIAQIPLSVDFFSNWFAENVISQGDTRKSFPIIEFIRNLSNSALAQSLLETCVNRKIKKTLRFTTGQISAYSTTNPPSDPMKEAWEASGRMILLSDNNPHLPLMGDSEQEGKDKSKGFFNYITLNVLGSSLTYTGHGDYVDDIDSGRYHVDIGSQKGIVKTVSFEKPDIMYIREARFMQQGTNGLLQLSAVYNVNLEMYGNTLFYPGMEVFVNPFGMGGTTLGSPTRGAGSVGGRSLANILGLGGYHTITHVNSSIGPGGFKTSVKALQYYSGDGSGNPNLVQRGVNVDLSNISETQEPEGDEAKEFCRGALAELADSWDTGLDGSRLEDKPAPPINQPSSGGGGGGGDGGGGNFTPANNTEVVPPPVRGPNIFTFQYENEAVDLAEIDKLVTFEYDGVEQAGAGKPMKFTLNGTLVAELKKTIDTDEMEEAVLTVYVEGGWKEYKAYGAAIDFPTLEELEINDTDLSPEDTTLDKQWDVKGTMEEPPKPPPTPSQPPPPQVDPTALEGSYDADLVLILGDSQSTSGKTMGGLLEKHQKDTYKQTVIGDSLRKSSKSVSWFLKTTQKNQLIKYLKTGPSSIFIFLGGNGATASDAKKLCDVIYTYSSEAMVFWVLPPPPANKTPYGQKKGQYDARKKKGAAIRTGIGQSALRDVQIFDPYQAAGWDKQFDAASQTYFGNPYTNYDGVHAYGESAKDLLKQFNLID